MVVLGAASNQLALKEESLLECIKILFKPRGKMLMEKNLKAFRLGRKAALG
ncbi:hypothetical protein ACFLRM_06485 [Acidobacteriota bacterium]